MNARTEWISMYTESAGATYNAEREELKRAAMLLDVLSSEFERIRNNFTDNLNRFRARLECAEVRVESKETGKSESVVDGVSKISFMSPDLFVGDSPDISSAVRDPFSVKLKSGQDNIEVLKSPKLNRNQRRTNRRRQNAADDRYPKLVADVEMPTNRVVESTPADDVVESTPEPAWRKPLKVVQTTTPARKVGASKRRKVQNNTLTQMYLPEPKSPDATLVGSPPTVEQDEDWDFITNLLKKSDSLPKSSPLPSQKGSTPSARDLHDCSTQKLSDDPPVKDKTSKQIKDDTDEAPKSLNVMVDEEYNRRMMKKDFEEYIEKCNRRPNHHVFATNKENDDEERRSPQVYHKTFTGFWDMDFPANETRNNNESTLFY